MGAKPAREAAASRPSAGKHAGKPIRRRGDSTAAARVLLEAVAALLLLCGGLLLAGHGLASSQEHLQQLALGTQGPTLAAWGRCVQRLRPASEGAGAWDGAGSTSWRGSLRQLCGELAVESACAVSAVRREAMLSWADAQPGVSGWLSAAWEKGWQGAAVARKHGGAALCLVSAAAQPVVGKLSSFTHEQCPACVRAMHSAARQSGRLVAAWLPVEGTHQKHTYQHDLYHGWLQSDRHISAAFAQFCGTDSACLQPVADAWSMRLVSACEPARAALKAAQELLKQSAQAVLPDQERPALRQAGSTPEQAAGSAGSSLAAAGTRVHSWVGGMLGRDGTEPAAQPEQEEQSAEGAGAQEGSGASLHDGDEQHPPHMHVLRWPLPGGPEGASSSQDEAQPAAHGVSHPASQRLAQPQERAREPGGQATPGHQQVDDKVSSADGAALVGVGRTSVEGSARSAEGVLQRGWHADDRQGVWGAGGAARKQPASRVAGACPQQCQRSAPGCTCRRGQASDAGQPLPWS